jgi:hypothetical protein
MNEIYIIYMIGVGIYAYVFKTPVLNSLLSINVTCEIHL